MLSDRGDNIIFFFLKKKIRLRVGTAEPLSKNYEIKKERERVREREIKGERTKKETVYIWVCLE
jgi:hypothetical protein